VREMVAEILERVLCSLFFLDTVGSMGLLYVDY
jgi:hypothetical protein